jgi:hypothetical protein
MGLIKAIAGRVRTLTRRYEDSVHIAHQAEALQAAGIAVTSQLTATARAL